jgi:hypothetical protein
VQPNNIFHVIDQLYSTPLGFALPPNRFYGNLGAKVPSDSWVKSRARYSKLGSEHENAQRSAAIKFYSRSHDAVVRVYDAAGNVIETHEHGGEFKE